MADITRRVPGDDCEGEGEHGEHGERGERGRRGHRGHRGHDGRDGRDGATGPTGPAGSAGFTGPTGSAGRGLAIIAAAQVNGEPPGDGFISNSGFSSYFRIAPGQYQLQLAGTPPPNTNCVVNVSLMTVFTIQVNISAFLTGAGLIHVTIETGNVPIDGSFHITVTDNS